MKIKLTKKQAVVMLACMEEIYSSPYWTNEETWEAFVGKTPEGENEIYQIINYLQEQYGLDTENDVFSRIFTDLRVSPVEK